MTARFFRRDVDWSEYERATGLAPLPGIAPPEAKYNIAPGSFVPVIRPARGGQLELALMHWGLVPQWWRKPLSEKQWSSFNARAEDAADAAAFRGALRYRRCLVPASGFYLWSGAKGRRSPVAFALTDHDWFCFAGLWECWGHDGGEIDTFAILTVPANDCVAPHGARMPVILEQSDHSSWIADGAAPMALARPFDAGAMHDWPVDSAVGNVRNQGPGLIG